MSKKERCCWGGLTEWPWRRWHIIRAKDVHPRWRRWCQKNVLIFYVFLGGGGLREVPNELEHFENNKEKKTKRWGCKEEEEN